MTSDITPQENRTQPKIVVGFDGSESAKGAVRYAITLAEALRADVELVTTWTYPISFSGFPLSGWSQEQEAHDLIAAITVELFTGGAPDWFSAEAVEGNAARMLITKSAGATMLVLGSRGHGGFTGLLLGSVGIECAAHATCPVLIVRHEAATG